MGQFDFSNTGQGAMADLKAEEIIVTVFTLALAVFFMVQYRQRNFAGKTSTGSSNKFSSSVLDSLREGILAVDTCGRLTLMNRAILDFHGLESCQVSTKNWSNNFLFYSSDGSRTLEENEHPLKRAFHGEHFEDLEVLILNENGQARYCMVNGRPVADQRNRNLGALIVVHDVSERRRSEQETARLASIVECSTDAVVGVNLDGIIVSWNAAATRLFAVDDYGFVGRPVSVIAEQQHKGSISEAIKSVIRGASVEQMELPAYRPDDKEVIVSLRYAPIQDTQAHTIGVSVTATDITVRKRAEAALFESQRALETANLRLKALATSDGLTGLKNRRALDTHLDYEFARSSRYRAPLSVILIDIDKFKDYNDSFGHQAGDDVIKNVADILTRGLRDSDIVARYGGEEMCVVLPETSFIEAGRVANRLRLAIANAKWEHRPVTASLGVAAFLPTMHSVKDLILAADQALYKSKDAGRNCVTMATTPDATPLAA